MRRKIIVNHGKVERPILGIMYLSMPNPIARPIKVARTIFNPTVLASRSSLKKDLSAMLRRNNYFLISKNVSYAAFIVFSISLFECARDMNPASNCEGARFIPLLSIPQKNLENFDVSESLAVL